MDSQLKLLDGYDDRYEPFLLQMRMYVEED